MEALVFRYLATAAGSLWALAAVLAAALSLWRLRSFNLKPTTSSPSPHLPPPTPPPAPQPFSVTPPPTSISDGLTKGRFIAYFHNNDYSGGNDDVDGECNVANRQWPAQRRSDVSVAVRRSGGIPTGWYRYQDRSVINGNIVRLWDGERVLSSAVME